MSTLKVTNIQSNGAGFNDVVSFQNSGGTQNGTLCRAWVNFNGTGTVAIRTSFNVSSITDNGTGDYTVNFTSAMVDANFVVSGSASLTTTSAFPRIMAPVGTNGFSATNIQVRTADDTGAQNDCAAVCVSIFR